LYSQSQSQVPFYEASALARINVEATFFDLVREIRKSGRSPNSQDLKGSKNKPGGKKNASCRLF
jgi:hypothetical protein